MAEGGCNELEGRLLQRLDVELHSTASDFQKDKLMSELGAISVPDGSKFTTKEQYTYLYEREHCYRMEHSRRGRAIVVTMTGNRDGWQADVKALHKMFLYLDVEPQFYFDCRGQELIEKMTHFASSEQNNRVDCLFVILMGHGGKMTEPGINQNKEYLLTSDGYAFFIRESFEAVFRNDEYRSLIDKPKIFVVQTCRGDTDTRGLDIFGTDILETDACGVPLARRIPIFSDYVIAFATQPDTKAYRSKVEGAWFIQELSQVFLESAADKTVLEMLSDVNQALEIRAGKTSRIDALQVGEHVFSLKAQLYLFPGLHSTARVPSEESDLRLLDYQEELAERARQGHNTIICSPTGSGKTIIAAVIAKDLRRRCYERKCKFKALFLVCTRHLAIQQRDAFRRVFTGSDAYTVETIPPEESLENMVEKHDVVMLTAQIFLNSLQKYEINGQGSSIVEYDLLIFDECHHTYYKHPYNTIMLLYQKRKRAGNTDLPQILGLSASLGVGPDDDAQEHYVTICANLDCTRVEHVRNERNMESFLRRNPRPTVDQIREVPAREDDVFISQIKQLMHTFQEKYLLGLFPSIPLFGSPPYQNWAKKVIKETKEDSPLNRIKKITVESLCKLNDSLMLYDNLQYSQVKENLANDFNYMDLPPEPLTVHREIFDEVTRVLQHIDQQTLRILENPKVNELVALLERLCSNREAKGIVLAKTRIVNKGLISIIENHHVLQEQIRVGRLVGQRGDKLTMTEREQQTICKKFQKDWRDQEAVDLLVATNVAQEGLDIPKCNYVIRYDFVSDEIGSVQSRGRARAKNSECYLIVTKGSINVQREKENLLREHKMLETLSQMDGRNLGPLIAQKQNELWQIYEADQASKSRKRDTDAFRIELLCSGCHAFLCRGSDIVKKGSHFLCDASDFMDRIDEDFEEMDNASEGQKTDFRYDALIGRVRCKKSSCKHKIGNLVKYKNDPYSREYGYNIRCKGILFRTGQDINGKDIIKSVKQWCRAPFQPEEEPLGN